MRPRSSRPRDVERVALRLGFVLSHQKGSHRIYKRSDGRRLTNPFHPGDVKTGLLRAIVEDMGITAEEFNRPA
ncbi:MAG: type II toxin-antitoxin system HicA family toxin [Planctomycetes bacterium]|nr:type II toxin-antitoxin system HicA family toxin [Planctomycetota bacterium]